MSRWVVTVEDETCNREVFGPWNSYDKAREAYDQLVARSSRYGGEFGDFTVDLDRLVQWPGVRAWEEGS